MSLNVLMLTQFPNEMELGKWYCSMMECPSQCYKHVVDDEGVHYILYLRWRWEDPWQGHIVKNACNEISMHNEDAEWSPNLLSVLRFSNREVAGAKVAIEQLWTGELEVPEKYGER